MFRGYLYHNIGRLADFPDEVAVFEFYVFGIDADGYHAVGGEFGVLVGGIPAEVCLADYKDVGAIFEMPLYHWVDAVYGGELLHGVLNGFGVGEKAPVWVLLVEGRCVSLRRGYAVWDGGGGRFGSGHGSLP